MSYKDVVYFVSYAHKNGFGNCHITVEKSKWAEETKEKTRDWLKSHGVDSPIVLFFHEL